MSTDQPDDAELAALRRRAETLLAAPAEVPGDEAAKLSHELSVFQLELELQNEELQRTNQALQKQVDRYFSLFDMAPVAYVLLDRQGRIQDINLAAADMFGRPRGLLISNPLLALVERDGRGELLAHVADVFARRTPKELNLHIHGPLTTHVLARSTWMADAAQEGRCLMALTDVTELRRAESLIQAAREEAERSDQAKSQFVAVLSHEIRTPLASVVAYCDLLLEQYPEHPGTAQLQLVSEAASHVTELVNDVLDISKIESDSLELQSHAFAPSEVADFVARITQPARDKKGIRLDVSVHDTAQCRLIGDGDRLRQCLLNLAGNAVKFTPQGGRVAISLAYRTGVLVTIVEDSGPGIPDAKKEEIFRPYRQADQTDLRNQGGVGLGLAITQRLTEMMGGQVLLSDSRLGGARFVLQIPFSATAGASEASPAAPPRVVGARRVREGPLLVVDDDPTIRMLMSAVLTHLEVAFELAESGAEALELLSSRDFRAVVLDMQMPQMDGMEVVRRIRMTPGIDDIPVAALTAKVMTHEVEACMSAGCDMHIAKPVSIETLRETLDELFSL